MMMIAENADLHRMQRAFRQVLDAFARPGTVHAVEPEAQDAARPASLDGALCTVARLFVDQAVTFAVADAESDAASRYLASETHARRTSVDRADFVIVPARADGRIVAEAVGQAKCGTPASPEQGATVIVGCACLAEGPAPAAAAGAADAADAAGADAEAADKRKETEAPAPAGLSTVTVSGPGVAGENRFAVDRVDWAPARMRRADEFPCGIEILLVAPDGRVVALPRTSAVALEGEVR